MLKQTGHQLQSPRIAREIRGVSRDAARRARDKALKRLLRAWLPLLLAEARYPSPSIGQHQQRENRHRQADAPGQRLDGAMAGATIPQEKEQPGKEADNHAKQHDNDGEL